MTEVLQDMGKWKRSSYCGEISVDDEGKEVVLMGWAHRIRNLGDLVFVDLRDRTGLVQVVFDASDHELHERAGSIRSEYVLAVKGVVRRRSPGNENLSLKTGQVEVKATEMRVLNSAKTPPILVSDTQPVDELLRMKYRFIDLRRPFMQRNLELRHKVVLFVRNYLSSQGFWEIETPMMTRSTPEGARDYLVPSRLEPGKFYALAQSPQLFKQLLMVGGIDRYFQIARCFRDEDLRADRQPEFTQIDIEMSFVDQEDVHQLVEGLVKSLWKEILGVEIDTPFPRLTYHEAISRYGSDKPDTRFGMEICDLTEPVKNTEFGAFKNAVASSGTVRGILVPGGAEKSRRELDLLTEKAKSYGASGLVTIAFTEEGIKSPAKKYLSTAEIDGIKSLLGAGTGDLALLCAGEWEKTCEVLGRLRLDLASEMGIIPQDKYNFLWIVDFPLLKRNEETGEWEAAHHPFTSPYPEDLDKWGNEQDKGKIRARMYDLVMNGVELASGSIRIHRRDLQEKVFGLLGLSQEEARDKFGYLLDAFEYGAPPHGGIAFGLDRFVMLMAGCSSIRDVLAFPKTARGTCPLTEAPAEVSDRQLHELGLEITRSRAQQ